MPIVIGIEIYIKKLLTDKNKSKWLKLIIVKKNVGA
jgi:hypothetical protein